ncbi:spore germination protein [Metabacillus sp. 84]|uniref:spore germination protein n=1 Tax=unclassified Metabacillus TaxID=2675274 RepID=UPI003CF6F1A9
MGVYIKNLVINEVSGGIVHFGNAANISPVTASKTAEGSPDMESVSSESANGTASPQVPSGPMKDPARLRGAAAQRQSRSN